MMYFAGENPGIGSYYCKKCFANVKLENVNKPLPECPRCHSSKFTR